MGLGLELGSGLGLGLGLGSEFKLGLVWVGKFCCPRLECRLSSDRPGHVLVQLQYV